MTTSAQPYITVTVPRPTTEAVARRVGFTAVDNHWLSPDGRERYTDLSTVLILALGLLAR
jgi:hypothetical protein